MGDGLVGCWFRWGLVWLGVGLDGDGLVGCWFRWGWFGRVLV